MIDYRTDTDRSATPVGTLTKKDPMRGTRRMGCTFAEKSKGIGRTAQTQASLRTEDEYSHLLWLAHYESEVCELTKLYSGDMIQPSPGPLGWIPREQPISQRIYGKAWKRCSIEEQFWGWTGGRRSKKDKSSGFLSKLVKYVFEKSTEEKEGFSEFATLLTMDFTSEKTPLWILAAKAKDLKGKKGEARYQIYSEMDLLLRKQKEEQVDRILWKLDVREFSVDILLTILTVTLAAKDILERREYFYERVREYLDSSGEPVDSLLCGLN